MTPLENSKGFKIGIAGVPSLEHFVPQDYVVLFR